MSEYRFVTHAIEGLEGSVRGMFSTRAMNGSAAAQIFPDIKNVAILPSEFDDEKTAANYLQPLLEKGGNAAAVRLPGARWLICAWVLTD